MNRSKLLMLLANFAQSFLLSGHLLLLFEVCGDAQQLFQNYYNLFNWISVSKVPGINDRSEYRDRQNCENNFMVIFLVSPRTGQLELDAVRFRDLELMLKIF